MLIDKPVSIRGETGAVIQSGPAHGLLIRSVSGGAVEIEGLRFDASGPSGILVIGPVERLSIRGAEFRPGQRPTSFHELYAGIRVSNLSGGTLVVEESRFMGGDVGVAAHRSSGIVIRSSTFSGQGWDGVDAAESHVEVSGNTFTRCERVCVRLHGTGTVAANTITAGPDAPVAIAILVTSGPFDIAGNVITGSAPVGAPPSIGSAITVLGDGTVRGNRVSGANIALQFHHGATTATDNVVSGATWAVYVGDAAVEAHRNDFDDYDRPLLAGALGSFTCNWWGSADGPANVDAWLPLELYHPWADGPIANGGSGSCGG